MPRRAVAKNVNPLSGRFEENPVRAALHVDGLDRLQSLGIPHDDGAAAAEAMAVLGVDCGAARPSISDRANRLERVEVKDQDLVAAGNIEAAAIVVRINIVDSACAHDLDTVDDLVRLGRGCRRSGGRALGKNERCHYAYSGHEEDA